ncbi:MAG TPA: DUF1328 domain-containing protein [Devosia sp.]|jgi:uncharacterized membrane protein YtjA (UPF0391 family)|nr:DUF1328 domain-containing protein [Devosia sp.]
MLRWAIIFFVISLIAGYFGFYRTSSATGTIAKILFALFLIGAVIVVIFALITASFVF